MTMDPRTTEQLQQGFKVLNRFMVSLFRLGLGPWVNLWPEVGGRIMVITHTGRRSGIKRYNPVNYTIMNGDVYCVAGFGSISDWYRNLRANPRVEIWLPDGWYAGLAEDVTGCPEHSLLMRQVLIASGFAARVAGINPQTFSDEALVKATADYRLVRIHRTAERTGRDGPGEMAWVWPLATFLLLPLVLRKKRNRRDR
ncbi:MAG: nitroreductase family deazaflavin-dependent oxidoreductase [Anaerolineaceae bacterium]|nr:nitroreductase family deazaflavin-dependent oxidoreductase [Anaerolineaceae bacterium]